jgi:hypothetical protein
LPNHFSPDVGTTGLDTGGTTDPVTSGGDGGAIGNALSVGPREIGEAGAEMDGIAGALMVDGVVPGAVEGKSTGAGGVIGAPFTSGVFGGVVVVVTPTCVGEAFVGGV